MNYILSMDYDGTLFEGSWPTIGEPIRKVINQVKAFKEAGASVILWTCREGKSLQEALSSCSKEGLEFDSVNESCPDQKKYQEKKRMENGEVFGLRKVFADLYIDDKSPGSIEYFLKLDVKKEMKRIEEKRKEFYKNNS